MIDRHWVVSLMWGVGILTPALTLCFLTAPPVACATPGLQAMLPP